MLLVLPEQLQHHEQPLSSSSLDHLLALQVHPVPNFVASDPTAHQMAQLLLKVPESH